MVSSLGLVPGLKIQDVHQPAPMDLEELKEELHKTVLQPSLNDEVKDKDWPKVSVQNLCFVPPMSPWQALQIF
jgi:hypothetical protein